MNEKLLNWARKIQASAQTGLAFSENEYEIERNKKLLQIASEMVEQNSDLDKNEIERIFLTQKGYATPKVDVRAAIIEHGTILLVQENTDGKWAMPGGWADVGDYPAKAAIREVFEESGYNVEVLKVIGVFDANRTGRNLDFFHAVKIVYLCKIIGGSPRPSNETLDVKFFDFNNLPEFSEFRTNQKHINEILKHIANPDSPTYFE